MVVVNHCRSVLLPDAQTLLNQCRSITLEHRLIFQAGPIADTWHLPTWKPLDCDCGSMAPLHPSPSHRGFVQPCTAFQKSLCFVLSVLLSCSPTLTLIGLLISDCQGMMWISRWPRAHKRTYCCVVLHIHKSIHYHTMTTHHTPDRHTKLQT